MLEALEQGTLKRVAGALGNALDGLSNADVGHKARQLLMEAGALGCNLSGSGPTVYGVFDCEETARLGVERCSSAGFAAQLCRPLARGCRLAGKSL